MIYPIRVRNELADFLDSLANGNSVVLGEFGGSDDPGPGTSADIQAEILRELADVVRCRRCLEKCMKGG